MKKLLLYLSLIVFISSCKKEPFHVLVFSKTNGFRHDSIETGAKTIDSLGVHHGWFTTHTEDSNIFTENKLKNFQVILFLNTTLDVLNLSQQAELERFIQAGGGFVGIHSATDTEYDWEWYNHLVGAQFESHPEQQEATLNKTSNHHNSTDHFPDQWTFKDEWYNLKNIDSTIIPLVTIDESSYSGGTNGENHLISWYHEYDGGRSFYTSLGHRIETWSDQNFLQHIISGIEYAKGYAAIDYSKSTTTSIPEPNRFHRTVLAQNLDEPMELVALNEEEILFIERKGDIKLYNLKRNDLKTVHHLDVYHGDEEGLIGIEKDPNYINNHFIYLFYSVPGKRAVQHVSRFIFENEKLNADSEIVILEVEGQREECCHVAGSIEFGPDGCLYIATGDNTNPFESDGFNPIDERPGRSPWDAQKSSANTNDLRGKILRIKINEDGTYQIPEGNLFPEGTDKTRPEIYIMGLRNPFRISLDTKTGWLYWGDVGPDAGKNGEMRGPKGFDELNQAKEAGFYGWPYTRGANIPYRDYNFATKESGDYFDPNHIINNSPNNTGLQELPPIKKSLIYYSYDSSELFPWVKIGGKNPMAGPIFHASNFKEGTNTFPDYFENKIFFYEWIRDWIYVLTLDENGNFIKEEPFMDDEKWDHPMDMTFGEDGNLYVLEYGQKWFSKNQDARLNKITFVRENRSPIPKFTTSATNGKVPLTVNLNGISSFDPDGDELSYSWSIKGKDSFSNKSSSSITFDAPGNYVIELKVTDKSGNSAQQQALITVGNSAPIIEVSFSKNLNQYTYGEEITYKVTITDEEDGNSNSTSLPGNLYISFNYLPEGQDLTIIGHQTAPSQQGLSLIEASDCKACHDQKTKVNGPSYMEIAEKYGDNDLLYLTEKVKNGGSGVWGTTPMAAHPQLSDADLRTIVNYILSLDEPIVEQEGLPLSGKLTFNKHPKTDTEGKYIFSVTYEDKGNQTAPPISAQKNITFEQQK